MGLRTHPTKENSVTRTPELTPSLHFAGRQPRSHGYFSRNGPEKAAWFAVLQRLDVADKPRAESKLIPTAAIQVGVREHTNPNAFVTQARRDGKSRAHGFGALPNLVT